MSKEEYIYVGKKNTINYVIDYSLDITYEEALEKLHPELIWYHVVVGNYEGEIVSLGKDKKGDYFYKMNDYGSCSGCDWVESINTEKEAQEFFKQQETLDSIGNNKETVMEYLKNETKNCHGLEETHLVELERWIDGK